MLELAVTESSSGQGGALEERLEAHAEYHEIVLMSPDAMLSERLFDPFLRSGFVITQVHDAAACLERVALRLPSAIILDVSSPRGEGLNVVRCLKPWQCPSPLIILTSDGDVPTAVEAMKNGAFDVVEKPFDGDTVVSCLRAAMLACGECARIHHRPVLGPFAGGELLTRREHEVLSQVAAGASNKEAGRLLGISPRTVEVHRARIMDKLGARNTADLIRIVMSEEPA
jgi:FixJ family two-component response regulator